MNSIIGKIICLFTTFILIFLPSITTVNGAQKYKITGTITDDSNRTQAGIAVIAYRASEEIDRDESNPEGSYEIEFDSGVPIDEVLYEKNGWNPDSIFNLSGQKDHVINKVIYRWGAMLSKAQIPGYIAAVSKLYSVSAAKGIPQDKFFVDVVGPASAVPMIALDRMPIPVYELGVAAAKKDIKKNIYDFISKDISFTIWKNLAEVVGFEKELETKGPYTVIMPVDTAFSALSPKVLLEAKSSKSLAQEIVFPQIIRGKFDYKQIVNMGYIDTLGGSKKVDFCRLNPIATDIRAENGYIHVVGKLYPELICRWDWKK